MFGSQNTALKLNRRRFGGNKQKVLLQCHGIGYDKMATGWHSFKRRLDNREDKATNVLGKTAVTEHTVIEQTAYSTVIEVLCFPGSLGRDINYYWESMVLLPESEALNSGPSPLSIPRKR